MSAARKIRVVCADDHRIVREGIGLIIGQQPDMAVVGTAADGAECLRLFRSERPDITLMDLQMGGMGGIDALRAIRQEDPGAKVIMLTMYIGDEDIHRAMSAGASGYLYKNTISDDLIRVIRAVHQGEGPVMSDEIRARLEEWSGRPRVTPREVEILELVSQGLRDKEIAEVIGISEKTVHVHVKNILAKLEAKDRTAAVRTAVQRGIIHMS
jgi:RNA polymerase sigma factor (sigma-70 family)